MKFKDVIALTALCSFLAAGAAIVQNYSAARAAVRNTVRHSSPFEDSSSMRTRFLTDKYQMASEEEYAYMALYKHAKEKNNVQEMSVIREAHYRHCGNKLSRPLVMKRRTRLQKFISSSTNDANDDLMSLECPPSLFPRMDGIFQVSQLRIF